MRDLSDAISEMKKSLPGWWFRVGECSVSCDATVGPDLAYCPKWMLERFDAGFDCDILQPSTLPEALRGATKKAVEALAEYERETPLRVELRRQ